jgi:hypothetical protein
MRRWASALAALLLANCIRTAIDLEHRPCPCAPGFQCCAGTGTCLSPVEVCEGTLARGAAPALDGGGDNGGDGSLPDRRDVGPPDGGDGAPDAGDGGSSCSPDAPCGEGELCIYEQGGCAPGVCRPSFWCSGDAGGAAPDSGVFATDASVVGDASLAPDAEASDSSLPADAEPADSGTVLPIYCGCDGINFVPSGCLVQAPWAHYGACTVAAGDH